MHVLSVVFSQNMMIFATYGFAYVKLMFWKVQAMLSSCVRCLKSGKMRPADSFWSSRARVVYIFEEELNGFLTVNFT